MTRAELAEKLSWELGVRCPHPSLNSPRCDDCRLAEIDRALGVAAREARKFSQQVHYAISEEIRIIATAALREWTKETPDA